MPTLVRNGEITEDAWTYDVANASSPEAGSILNAEDFTKQRAGELHGVLLDGSVEIEDIIDQVKRAALIAISLAGFGVVRGLSLAGRGRARGGWRGVLGAVGGGRPDWAP